MKPETQQEKFKRLTEDKLYPLLWRMALPSMVGMAVSSVYSSADTYFVSRLGRTDLTAAVGVVFSFISVIQAVGFWFGYGSGNYVSRQLGKKNYAEADRMTSVGFGLAVTVGVAMAVLGTVFLRPLAVLLGGNASDQLLEATVSYLRITLFTVPIMLGANLLYNVLRLQGSAKDSMIGMLVGMLLNTLLDPLFIIVLKMGIAGAAVASLIGQLVGLILLLLKIGKNGNTSLKLSKAKPTLADIKEILAGGAPNFCRQGISSISTVILNHIAGGFGEAAIAGVGVSMRILYLGYALVIGFGQGFQPICAVNYGAEKYDRIKTAFKYALITATVFLTAAAVLFFTCSERLVLIFTDDSAVCKIGSEILKAQSLCLPFMAYYILIGMLLQNIGRFGWATLVTVAENGTFLIPLAIIMPALMGYQGLIWCKSAASLCALVFSFIIGHNNYSKFLNRKAGKP